MPTLASVLSALCLLSATTALPSQHSSATLGSSRDQTNRKATATGFSQDESSVLPLVPAGRMPLIKRSKVSSYVDQPQPTQAGSTAVLNVGDDLAYMAVIKFGTSSKPYYMLLDSGAVISWVMGPSCNSTVCKSRPRNTFGPSDSPGMHFTSGPFYQKYGPAGSYGGVTFDLVKDTISLAGFTVPYTFGIVNDSSGLKRFRPDGLLGLGPGYSGPTQPSSLSIVRVLFDQGAISAPLFGIDIPRGSDATDDGEISFGAPNPDRYSGNLSYTNAETDIHWVIPLDDAGVDGSFFGFSGRTAMIDTGNSFIHIPPADAEKLLSGLGLVERTQNFFAIPCSSTRPIQMVFSGVPYNISYKDYLLEPGSSAGDTCLTTIMAGSDGETQWVLGDTFLKNVYTVFDFDNKRVGFGVKD